LSHAGTLKQAVKKYYNSTALRTTTYCHNHVKYLSAILQR